MNTVVVEIKINPNKGREIVVGPGTSQDPEAETENEIAAAKNKHVANNTGIEVGAEVGGTAEIGRAEVEVIRGGGTGIEAEAIKGGGTEVIGIGTTGIGGGVAAMTGEGAGGMTGEMIGGMIGGSRRIRIFRRGGKFKE